MLYDIVRKLPEGAQVSLETAGDTGQMQCARAARVSCCRRCPRAISPISPRARCRHRFTLPPAELKRLIDKTQFAISTEETRYYLNGIYLHTIERRRRAVLRAVATDGHRLARVEVAAPAGADGMPGVIVPRKAVAEIQKLMEDGEEQVDDRALVHQDPPRPSAAWC